MAGVVIAGLYGGKLWQLSLGYRRVHETPSCGHGKREYRLARFLAESWKEDEVNDIAA